MYANTGMDRADFVMVDSRAGQHQEKDCQRAHGADAPVVQGLQGHHRLAGQQEGRGRVTSPFTRVHVTWCWCRITYAYNNLTFVQGSSEE